MSKFVLAIDAGTTNSLAMVVDETGSVRSAESRSLKLSYPAPRLVEFDAEHYWLRTLEAIHAALDAAGIEGSDLAAIGITGQRSTLVIWDRNNSKPVCPAVVWQDLRGSQRTEELIGAGFARLMIYFPAVKLEQVLRNLPNGFERANNGELAVGNVDSFLAWKLSNGAIHVTDASNASALGYFDFSGTWSWQENLLKLQGLPVTLLPNVVDSVGAIGYTDPGLLGAEVPIGSIIGDQQSALYGQGCVSPGMMKISYGTSAICNVNSGPEIKCPTGTYAFPAWTRDGVKTFLVEGIVITAGAVFDWLTRLGILDTVEQAGSLAMEAADTKGVSFLPALQGLGSPHNAFDRFGAFDGLTLGASKSHVVRAAIEGVTFRVREVVDSIYTNTGLPRPHIMRVDGGATENELLMQTQANVLGCTIEKMLPGEATAYGAALLAGEACGVWEPDCSRRLRRVERTWEPQWSNTERDGRFDRWKQAFGL